MVHPCAASTNYKLCLVALPFGIVRGCAELLASCQPHATNARTRAPCGHWPNQNLHEDGAVTPIGCRSRGSSELWWRMRCSLHGPVHALQLARAAPAKQDHCTVVDISSAASFGPGHGDAGSRCTSTGLRRPGRGARRRRRRCVFKPRHGHCRCFCFCCTRTSGQSWGPRRECTTCSSRRRRWSGRAITPTPAPLRAWCLTTAPAGEPCPATTGSRSLSSSSERGLPLRSSSA